MVFAAAAIAPMAVAASRRAGGDPGAYAQSEVIVVEEAATALLDARNPYVAEYRDGPLAERPVATQIHFPYLPGMLAFGIPRAWPVPPRGRMLGCGSRWWPSSSRAWGSCG